MTMRRDKMLELATMEEIIIVGAFAAASIVFLIMAVSVFKKKHQRSSFFLALGAAFCFAIWSILFAWEFGFF